MSTVTCSPGMQATGGPVLRCTGRAKSNPHPHSGLNARGKWKSRKNPFWESLPWTCPQPVPADLGAGPGQGHSTLTFFPALGPQTTPWAPGLLDNGCFKVQPKWGLVFSLSVSPGWESLTCGPNTPQRTTLMA